MSSLASQLRSAGRELGIPRLRAGELPCSACEQPGRLVETDDRGHLIQHPGRVFLCRVPADDITVLLWGDQ